MFKNYITTAFRNLVRNKLYSAINIGGLAIGLAAVILISLFVRDELSYDTWIPDVERIHKLEMSLQQPGGLTYSGAFTPGPVAPTLQDYFAGDMEAVARIYEAETTVRNLDRQFTQKIHYVDANVFTVFDLPMAMGDREAAVSGNTSIIISQAMARKYFGESSPLGQILNIDHAPTNSSIDFNIVGVFQDIPRNSHLDFQFVALLDPARYENWPWVTQDWLSATNHTYVKLRDGVDIAQIETRLPDFVRGLPIEPPAEMEITEVIKFNFISVLNIHLHAGRVGYFKPGGDIVAVVTFSTVAVLILLIASINFMNLSTAQAMKRAREVSMRKVVGAARRQLVVQFLGEAVTMTVLAMILALGLVKTALPFYSNFLDKNLTLDLAGDPIQAMALVGLVIIVGILGGSYPAFFLSSFRPAKVLLSGRSSGSGSTTLRQALVVVQFTISIGLIIATGVVYGQTIFARNMDLGFDKAHKLTLTGAGFGRVAPFSHTLKQELARVSGVTGVALSSDKMPRVFQNSIPLIVPGQNNGQPINIEFMVVDADFFPVFGIAPSAGRSFSAAFRGDFRTASEDPNQPTTRGAIVNESFLQRTGFSSPEDALNQLLTLPAENGPGTLITIVGVIPDLHMESVHTEVSPMIFLTTESGLGFVTVDIQTNDLTATIKQIENVWYALAPDVPLISSFVDDDFEALYQAEEQRGEIFAAFAIFAVMVASLGLYGLAAFTAERRAREIGLRKVLGARVFDIVKLLTLQFSIPVVLANIIAWPVAYLIMQDWLNGFSYRIDLNLGYFALAGGIALIIAWFTVGGHAFNVARKNPVKSLHYE